jgi:uncharacterized protein (DUF427 family)
MVKATWEGAVLAESDRTVEVEGNQYFPPESVVREFFQDSASHTVCPWKGKANYYDVVVGGKTNKDAAWFYPAPLKGAEHIQDYVAFWRGVSVAK